MRQHNRGRGDGRDCWDTACHLTEEIKRREKAKQGCIIKLDRCQLCLTGTRNTPRSYLTAELSNCVCAFRSEITFSDFKSILGDYAVYGVL